MQSQDPGFHRLGHARESGEFSSPRRHSRPRMPSTSGYMMAASATAGALFFLLWWMLQGDENPWVPAGLAASVVMLVAVAAREVVIRRAWTRHILEEDNFGRREYRTGQRSSRSIRSPSLQSAAWRALRKRSAAVDANDSLPEAHREIYQLCTDYLESTDEALRAPDITPENRLALRAAQERVRTLQRHHLLTWARDSARSLTRDAQQRVRLHEKIEIANRALDCIDKALLAYPNEHDLNQSAWAVREFITSSRVAHWVELAERAAFKGYYRRAIDCYRDALFYLMRDGSDQAREAAAERISREIELLRARLATQKAVGTSESGDSNRP